MGCVAQLALRVIVEGELTEGNVHGVVWGMYYEGRFA